MWVILAFWGVCVDTHARTHEARFPRRSELGAGVECPGAEVSYSFKPSDLTWVLGNELRSSTKAVHVLNL